MGSAQERAQPRASRVRLHIAATTFAGPTLERTDTRRDYGELRRVVIGRTHGVCLTLVYTDRYDTDGELVRRIISARRSKRREYRAYAKAYPEP